MTELPQAFLNQMNEQLGADFSAFQASFAAPAQKGLRVNTLKCTSLAPLVEFQLEEVAWAKWGFYYNQETRPGKHPYHEAGVYYLQEPSAMSVAALAQVQPGEHVLDLCAAPGGKSTALAADLAGEGLLISNEIHPNRAKILSRNIERMGVKNAVVTNETPQRLTQFFPLAFDCVVVDAPCSGEGMFRKDEEARKEWNPSAPELCAARQREILTCAVQMLRPGGRLIYSTCTFNEIENEAVVDWLVREFGFALVEQHRLWPHVQRGEGHFAAWLRKPGEGARASVSAAHRAVPQEMQDGWLEFARQTLRVPPQGELVAFGEQLSLLPCALDLDGLRVLRAGLQLGAWKKGRFEPLHALALSLKQEEALRVCNLDLAQAQRYLKGETLPSQGEKGWTLVTVDGFSLGWGKVSDGILKNHLPKGLRWL